jgi:hypothetical protein
MPKDRPNAHTLPGREHPIEDGRRLRASFGTHRASALLRALSPGT